MPPELFGFFRVCVCVLLFSFAGRGDLVYQPVGGSNILVSEDIAPRED